MPSTSKITFRCISEYIFCCLSLLVSDKDLVVGVVTGIVSSFSSSSFL